MNALRLHESQLQKMKSQPGFIAAQQSDAEFNALLDAAIQSIFEASTTKDTDRKQGRERLSLTPVDAKA